MPEYDDKSVHPFATGLTVSNYTLPILVVTMSIEFPPVSKVLALSIAEFPPFYLDADLPQPWNGCNSYSWSFRQSPTLGTTDGPRC
jgi:hypothetical protein